MELQLQEHTQLSTYTTFGVPALARYFIEITAVEQLDELRHLPEFGLPRLWIGGGSNMLLTQNFEGLAIKLSLKGMQQEGSEPGKVLVSAGAGENWHQFVEYCLQQNWGGLENLSLIPGNVGTAPMQNIGAYGAEIKDTLSHIEAWEVSSGKVHKFTNEQCRFGYRDSIFKQEYRNQYVITKVYFKLSTQSHSLHTEYGAISQELAARGYIPNIHRISEVVCAIRRIKLPDPAKVGNAGSFFKNPVVPITQAEALQAQYPNMPFYKLPDNQAKLAAGWLIEQCGWKGYREGNYGVHPKQALVLVNYGGATGSEIRNLADAIKQSVFRKFALSLEIEVNII